MLKKGVLLVPDGLQYPLFQDMLARGALPHIQHYIVNRALVNVEHAFTGFPSSTFEQMPALMTGQRSHQPGAIFLTEDGTRVNYIGNDNPSKGNTGKRDTIFRFIDQWTVSIFNPWNDHADDKHFANHSLKTLAQYARGWAGSNGAAVSRLLHAMEDRQPLNFAALWFFAMDRYGHKKSDHALAQKYQRFDSLIGKIGERLEERGELEETLLILTSDHGMAPVQETVNPYSLCESVGLDNARVFAYGYGVGSVYTSSTDLASQARDLTQHPAVEHVILPQGTNVRRVYSEASVADVVKEGDRYRLDVHEGLPFGYSADLCEALSRPHTARESLELTHQEEQPNAVVGTAESLRHTYSPQMTFLAAPGHAFGLVRNWAEQIWLNANYKRSHGTFHRGEAQVPLLIAGDGEPCVVPYAETIDWAPTFFKLAGRPIPPVFDGVPLV
ncbi:MAG: alkaline phosphatase family protein [Candidatus Woesearchaeota archaeon]|nr:alkaline phosphatase family protein [Candidatus Woesearchaeota archaeon]